MRVNIKIPGNFAELFEGGVEIFDESMTLQDMKTSSVIALVKNRD